MFDLTKWVISIIAASLHISGSHATSPPEGYGTLVTDLWTDDFAYSPNEADSWKGWRCRNKLQTTDSDGEYIRHALPETDIIAITGGVPLFKNGSDPTHILQKCQGDCDTDGHCADGLTCYHRRAANDPFPPGCTNEGNFYSGLADFCSDGEPVRQYWGPLSKDVATADGAHGSDNYWSRWFKCASDADRVVVSYQTAGCGQTSDGHGDDDVERTTLWVDWHGDDQTQNHVSTLGAPDCGYDPYTGSPVVGHLLDDSTMNEQCTYEEKPYWVQQHGFAWTPPVNEHGATVKPANESFRTMIKIQSGEDVNGDKHLVLLFNISVRCSMGVEYTPAPTEKTEDSSSSSEEENEKKLARITKLFRVLAVVLPLGASFALAYFVYKWFKRRRMGSQASALEHDDEAVGKQMTGIQTEAYDMRPVELAPAQATKDDEIR